MPVPLLGRAIRRRHSAVDEERGSRVVTQHIEESPEECGTSLDISSKQAMRFVDEANSDISHPCFDHGSYNVHLVHVNTW